MADSTLTDTLAIWAYWILGLLIVGTMCYVMYTRFNKQVAAVLTFLISMLALYYYYVKWFILGDAYKETPSVCPDFMAKLTVDGDNVVCYNPSKFTNKNAALTSYVKPTQGTSNGYVDADGKYVIAADAANMGTFCTTLKGKDITWVSACKSTA